jgi:hypothetical protein
MAWNVTFNNGGDWAAARKDFYAKEYAKGRGQDDGGKVTGSDGIKYDGASPFIGEPDEQGNTKFRYNKFIATNHKQGDAGEPSRQFLNFTNDQAMRNFREQSDVINKEAQKGRDAIAQMFNIGQATQFLTSQMILNS